MKLLHSFEIVLEHTEIKKDVIEENGSKITKETPVKIMVPHTIVFKEPSRREKQELSLFYSVTYTEALDKKLWPKVLMVQKLLKDPSSPLSQGEDENLSKLYEELEGIRNDLFRVGSLPETEEQKIKKEQLSVKYLSLQRKVMDIETAYQSLFAHTAESYAKDLTLQWIVYNLFYIRDGEKYKPFFEGKDFESRRDFAYGLEEKNDELYLKSVDKMALYAGLYFLGQANKSEDFKSIDVALLEQLKQSEIKSEKTEEKTT